MQLLSQGTRLSGLDSTIPKRLNLKLLAAKSACASYAAGDWADTFDMRGASRQFSTEIVTKLCVGSQFVGHIGGTVAHI